MKRFATYMAEKQAALPNLSQENLEDDKLMVKFAKYAGIAFTGFGIYQGIVDVANQEYSSLFVDSFAVVVGGTIAKVSHAFEVPIQQELDSRLAQSE